jgi:ribonucleoside-diphosphate reductase alpha chain
LRAYFEGRSLPKFDFDDIRPKGTPLRTAGGVAPGPEPLRDALYRVNRLLERVDDGVRLSSLQVHDICCFLADAVRAGGIRRSAMIALFSVDDEDMLSCKAGNFLEDHPQRQRANNSAVILRHRVQRPDFDVLWERMQVSNAGEPGLFFSNSSEWGLNPCGEVSLRSHQFCNLTTVNFATVQDQQDLEQRVRAASMIATLQATYTDFHYLREDWQTVTEREALIGVSLNGLARPDLQEFDLTAAAKVVKDTNAEFAAILGINRAARTTVVKPDGTCALVLQNSSGIHAWHAPYFLRRMQLAKSESLYGYLASAAPGLVEDDLQKPQRDAFVVVPVKAPEGAQLRTEPAIDLMQRVTHVYDTWIVPGHRKGQNTNNVSTTVSVRPDEWDTVGNWVWENRNRFTAMAFLPYDGGVYTQAPFEDIMQTEYDARVQAIPPIDLSLVTEWQDATSLQSEPACAGGACAL